ncbi:RNA methyltransferase [Mycobacterium leprae]|uniref:RNA methyltransferase n=1 Tax=Mycobacterium leprae TaxID=1769 RepID=A0AAD0KXX5_MYCLR|nr:RNA methyltransferase [Mycobacterium leprae]
MRRRCRTTPLQRTATLAARANGGPLIGAGFADSPPATRVTGHQLAYRQPTVPTAAR